MDSSNFSSAVPVRILLVDNFEPFRKCVRSLFVKPAEWVVLCEVSDGFEAVQKAEELQPGLILLDIDMPKLSKIEVARRIRKLYPDCRILFVSRVHRPSRGLDNAD